MCVCVASPKEVAPECTMPRYHLWVKQCDALDIVLLGNLIYSHLLLRSFHLLNGHMNNISVGFVAEHKLHPEKQLLKYLR